MKNSKILMFGYIYLFNNNIKYLKKYITAKKMEKSLYKFSKTKPGSYS